MSDRKATAEKAAALKAEGLKGAQIAERLGISRSYAYDLLSDPEGLKGRARKESYRGACEHCGGGTNGSNGPYNAARLCAACQRQKRHDDRKWTPESVVAAMRAFSDRYGHPPTSVEWNPPHARTLGRSDWSERFYADGCWPLSCVVQREFETWNAALEAAGFDPRGPGDQLYRQPRAA